MLEDFDSLVCFELFKKVYSLERNVGTSILYLILHLSKVKSQGFITLIISYDSIS